MEKGELTEIIKQHAMWLNDTTTGQRANLQRADLRESDLRWAYLQRADLRWANLQGAYLQRADLRWANLQGADLQGADLQRADLQRADLRGVDLREADLRGADLRGADLQRADLQGAYLQGVYLQGIKEDFYTRILLAKNEIVGLYDYLIRGRVDGSCYSGECACFVGTIANIVKESYQKLSCGLTPDSNSATEKWFTGISKGDTPENNQVSKITCEWIEEFCKENNIQLPEYKLVSSFELPIAFPGVNHV